MEEIDGGKEGQRLIRNQNRRIERFEGLSISITIILSLFYYFSRGGNIKRSNEILRRWRNAAETCLPPFCRVQCVTRRTAAFESACCKRATRIEMNAYGELREPHVAWWIRYGYTHTRFILVLGNLTHSRPPRLKSNTVIAWFISVFVESGRVLKLRIIRRSF